MSSTYRIHTLTLAVGAVGSLALAAAAAAKWIYDGAKREGRPWLSQLSSSVSLARGLRSCPGVQGVVDYLDSWFYLNEGLQTADLVAQLGSADLMRTMLTSKRSDKAAVKALQKAVVEAASRGHTEVLRLLLEDERMVGLRVKAMPLAANDSESPSNSSKTNLNGSESASDVNDGMITTTMRSALCEAVLRGHMEVVHLLLEYEKGGHDGIIRSGDTYRYYWTLILAALAGQPDIVRLLLSELASASTSSDSSCFSSDIGIDRW